MKLLSTTNTNYFKIDFNNNLLIKINKNFEVCCVRYDLFYKPIIYLI